MSEGLVNEWEIDTSSPGPQEQLGEAAADFMFHLSALATEMSEVAISNLDKVPEPVPISNDDPVRAEVVEWGRAPATRGVASTMLLRAVRSPLQFVFVVPPLLAAINFMETAVTSVKVPWYVPCFVVWYGTWAAGAVIPLNPLGNQGSMLPALLTAPARGRHVVHGNVVADAVLGAPLTAGVAIAAGFLAGSSTPVLAVLGVAGVASVVGSAVIVTGIESVFPRFQVVRFDASRQAVPPSKRAYSLFSTYLILVVVAVAFASDETARTVGSLLISQWLPWGVTVSVDSVFALSWVGLLAGVAAIPIAYRIAIHRIETYRV